MDALDVIDSFSNSWSALAKQYEKYPDETTRNALNFIGKIIDEIKSDYYARTHFHQITIDEWIKFFEENGE